MVCLPQSSLVIAKLSAKAQIDNFGTRGRRAFALDRDSSIVCALQ
jgi:hypothetical protein